METIRLIGFPNEALIADEHWSKTNRKYQKCTQQLFSTNTQIAHVSDALTLAKSEQEKKIERKMTNNRINSTDFSIGKRKKM